MKRNYILVSLIVSIFILIGSATIYSFQNINVMKIQGSENSEVSSSAYISWETNGILICNATNDQNYIVYCSDGVGGVIIAWRDFRIDTNGDIYAQRINSTGQVYWTPDGIPICTDTNTQEVLRMVSDNNGGAIIAWTDHRGANRTIYVQRINSSGDTQWTDNGIAICSDSFPRFIRDICSDNDGGAIISFNDDRNLNGDIYAQRVTSNGIINWTADGVPICNDTSDQIILSMCSDDAGGAIIAWEDQRPGLTNADIYAQRVNFVGQTLWTNNGTPICTSDNRQTFVAICEDGSGGAFITWADRRYGITTYDIFMQRINSTGTVNWTNNGTPICTVSGNQRRPRIITDGLGGAIITWEDDREMSGLTDIYAQRVNGSGFPLWEINGTVIADKAEDQYDPLLCTDGAAGAFITWEEDELGGGINTNIYAQWINKDGKIRWTTSGAPIYIGSGDAETPKICSDGNKRAYIIWVDDRNGDQDIFAQHIINGSYGAGGGPDLSGILLSLMGQPANMLLPITIIIVFVAVVVVIVIIKMKQSK